MTIKEVYEKYKRFDKFFCDEMFLDSMQAKARYDMWQAIRAAAMDVTKIQRYDIGAREGDPSDVLLVRAARGPLMLASDVLGEPQPTTPRTCGPFDAVRELMDIVESAALGELVIAARAELDAAEGLRK